MRENIPAKELSALMEEWNKKIGHYIDLSNDDPSKVCALAVAAIYGVAADDLKRVLKASSANSKEHQV